MAEKKKILALCDHPLSVSGVGVQSRYLLHGLLDTGEYTIRCFGAAVKHANYDVVSVPPTSPAWSLGDFMIKPIDGFGDTNTLRQALAIEKPDALFLFTDPRFFIWVWEMEEEIHQLCPIVYWHVWDNDPWPEFNRVLYESTDLLNCHSYLTYSMVKEHFPEKTNFIPHALPTDVFKPLSKQDALNFKIKALGKDRADHFVCLWMNRNAKRKRGNDVLESWKIFLDMLYERHGHRNATLIMHTDPFDSQGSNLVAVSEMLGVQKNVFFSAERLDFEQIAALHNISDCCINISMNEGFGLTTLEAMQCGKPIIALKTGGLTRQVVDHRDGSENGIALPVELRSLVGSQMVPYIYEDYVSTQTTAKAILRLFEMGKEEREKLGEKCRSYVLSQFNLKNTIEDWHKSLKKTIEDWKEDRSKLYKPWALQTF